MLVHRIIQTFPDLMKHKKLSTMRHGKDIITEEQGKIAAVSLAGWNISEIAKVLKRSRTTARNYLDPKKRNNANRLKSGGKAQVTPRIR